MQKDTSLIQYSIKGSGGLVDKVSALQPQDRGFESHMGYDYDSSYDTSTREWFKLWELTSQLI